MKFDLLNPYHSLESLLCPEDLPDFVVITGLNGSGKSHLLQALDAGNVVALDGENKLSTKLFDLQTIKPKAEQAVRDSTWDTEKEAIWESIMRHRSGPLSQMLKQLSGFTNKPVREEDAFEMAIKSYAELFEELHQGDKQQTDNILVKIRRCFQHHSYQLIAAVETESKTAPQNRNNQNVGSNLRSIAATLQHAGINMRSILELDYLKEAVDRQRRSDWIHTAIGVFVTIAVTMTINTDTDDALTRWIAEKSKPIVEQLIHVANQPTDSGSESAQLDHESSAHATESAH